MTLDRTVVALGLSALAFGCQPAGQRDASPRAGIMEPALDLPDGSPDGSPDNPKELGWVRWERDLDAATSRATSSGKPLFVLFQEVPGCSTCVGFGETVLSHPLLVEAIETDFVPLAIHNNKSGADAEVLRRFSEPAWNNPVVRFLDASGKDLLPRTDGVWGTREIAKRMVEALRAGGHAVPAHLLLVLEETTPDVERTTFEMYCYWAGEACLGDIPGVLGTEAAELGGREVVHVDFDPQQVDLATLQGRAADHGCGRPATSARGAKAASVTDRKYHLIHSLYRYLPLTPLQATRVNSALSRGTDPGRWLSPRQRALLLDLSRLGEERLEDLPRPEDVRELAAFEHRVRARLALRESGTALDH